MRILVVEDDPQDYALLMAAIDDVEFGVNLTHVTTLKQALARPAHDVILLDLGLPDSQGADTLIRMRDAFPTVPIVVLTGSDDPELATLLIRAGARDFITKQGRNMADVLRAAKAASRAAPLRKMAPAKAVLEAVRDPASIDHLLRIINDAALAGPVVAISTRHGANALRSRWLDGNVSIMDLTGAECQSPDLSLQPEFLELLCVYTERTLAKFGVPGMIVVHLMDDFAATHARRDLQRFVRFMVQRGRSIQAHVRFLVSPGQLHGELGLMIRPLVDHVRTDFESSKMGAAGRGSWM